MDFPEEMITELLIRLPLKSVIKLKCVCKDWNNLISMPEFRKCYQFRHHKTCPIGFVYHPKRRDSQGWTDPAKFVCTSNIDKEELGLCHNLGEFGKIVGSSKGLLLLYHHHRQSFCVYDPLTRKDVMLPKTFDKYKITATGFICKEREQIFPKNLIGNGSYLTYKVVIVRVHFGYERSLSDGYEVETYSSETGKWHKSAGKWYKSTMVNDSLFSFELRCRAKVIGGMLHWEDHRGKNIIAYDPEDRAGRVKWIETPSYEAYIGLIISGTQDERLLCVTESMRDGIAVWVLGRKYERGSYLDEDIIDRTQWTLIHKIDSMEYRRNLPDSLYYGSVGIHPQDSSVIYLRRSDKFISYNLKEKRVETVISKCEGESFLRTTYFDFEWPSWPGL